MKTILRFLGVALLLGIWANTAPAQDLSNPTFSQYHYTPFLTNPGMFASGQDIQLSFNYRRKQVEAGESFDTPMFSILYPFMNKATNRHIGSAGLTIISDNAVGFLKTNGFLAGYAHKFSLGGSYLNIGLQGGYFQKRVDLDGQSTGAQFISGFFNPAAGSGEMIDGQTKGYLSLGGGAFWGMDDEMGRQKAFLGVSYLNFTEPDVAFVEGMGANLPASFVATGGVRVLQTDRFSILPSARFLNFAGNNQLNLGSWFRYHFIGASEGFVREGSLGLGTWYDTNDALVLLLEFNQPNYMLAVSYDVPTSNDISSIQRNGVFELTAALKLRKGKPEARPSEDRDGDGVADENDACPDTPGTKALLGCPDSDGDGIPDKFDNCPSESGPQNLGGCPDSDGDGIADKDDACPNAAGTRITNGCPDKDNDGVPDKDDLCPDVPGVPAKQGCPASEVQLTPTELKILESAKYVHFQSGTAIIEATSYSNLDLVVEVMKVHPNDLLELVGHTDDVGDADENLRLGQERADAVRAYLVSKGTPASQINTSSFGEEKPIADNSTEEGRSLNRRVEMRIIKK